MILAFSKKERDRIAQKYFDQLKLKYPEVFDDSFSIYTDNHPYVWGEVPKEEFKSLFEMSVSGARGAPLDPPMYCYKIDVVAKRFYFIPLKTQFDFSSRMHYREWLDSQKEVSERIENYKKSR